MVSAMGELFAKAAAFVAAQKERFGLIVIGQTFNAIFDHIFNYWIYIPVVAYYGPWQAFLILTAADIFLSLLFIRFYDWAKKDWLGLETAKEIRDFGPKWIRNLSARSRIGRMLYWPFSRITLFVLWAMKKGDVFAFFALSVFFDPFITTVYLRRKSYGGMGRREWFIFLSSAVVSNGWWTIRTFGIVIIAKIGIEHLF